MRTKAFLAALAVVMTGTVLGPVSGTGAVVDTDGPNVAYTVGVNIPEFDGQALPEFTCQLCETADGGKPAPDYLATVDVDEGSPTYGQVISRTRVPNSRPELHHMAMDSKRKRVVAFDLYQDEANIFDIHTDPRAPRFLRAVHLGEASRRLLGTVPGLFDSNGLPVSVGYAMPHVAYRMPNGNFVVAMVSVYAPGFPDLHRAAPGGFVEMTPDGTVLNAFPKLRYDATSGTLTNDQFTGNGVFSIDYSDRMGLMAHADLMTARQFLCAGLLLDPKPGDFGTQVVLWDVKQGTPSAATVFQRIDMPAPFITAPGFAPRPVNGLDVIFVTTFSSGLWALTRPTGTNQQFQLSDGPVYALDASQGHGLVHLRFHPTKNVVYLSDPYGETIHVLDFNANPLAPAVVQKVPLDEVHMMKFSQDGRTFYASTGVASVLGFALQNPSFSPANGYGIKAYAVQPNGSLTLKGTVFDGSREGAKNGVFVGDFFLRRNPHPFV